MPPRKRTTSTPAGSSADFVYESSEGTITVPSLTKVPKLKGLELLDIQAIEDPVVQQARMIRILLGRAAGPAAMRLIAQLDMDELGEFIEAWGEHSGVSLGE